MQTRISAELSTVLAYSQEEAMRTGCYSISSDHILLGILRHADNDACRALSAIGVDLSDLKNTVESQVFKAEGIAFDLRDNITFERSALNVINLSVIEASMAGADHICTAHMLLATTRASGSRTQAYLRSIGLDRATIAAYMKQHSMLQPKRVDSTPTPKVHIIEVPSAAPGGILS